MDTLISAVASELVSRFISFLSNKYRSKACLKMDLEMLQHLLLRAHTVVEEAEGGHIVNSRMLTQLKTLTEAMFRGYHVLDTYMALDKIGANKMNNTTTTTVSYHQVKSALGSLETAVANTKEFVVLLTGCDRMSRSPYSAYLYIDNFMFGRHVERQQAINILTTPTDEENPCDDQGAPMTVLPVIGGCRVGKKTLVESICRDGRIHAHYSSFLHLSGEDAIFQNKKIIDRGIKLTTVRTLVTVELVSDVADGEWLEFYSLLSAYTGRGSKVIIISRVEEVARFGTVGNPVRISSLSPEEYSYLFKVLAFGSANPTDHPRLALAGKELATVFQGSLVMLNVYTSVLRKNLNVRFKTRQNLAVFGEHPKTLLEKEGASVDITGLSLSSSLPGTSFRLVVVAATTMTEENNKSNQDGGLPVLGFGDIIAGFVNLPRKFRLVWKSRLPPYRVISANCAAEETDHHQRPVSPRKKRPRLCESL